MDRYDPSTIGAKVPDTAWFKASLSGDNGGACAEVAYVRDGAGVLTDVLLRDSKQRSAAALQFTPPEWAAFLNGVGKGEFTPS